MTIKKKFFVGAFIAAFAFFAASASAAYMHTVTLKQGSSGTQVMYLQQTLNMTSCALSAGAGSAGLETTTFGPKTKVAVQCFQAANGLVADGIVGPATGAKLAMVSGTPTGGNFPAGCTSSVGFSPTTGQPCSGGSSTPSTGGLSGGAADIDVTKTSTDVEDDVREGQEDIAVAGFEVEADGGDVAITSVRVTFAKTTANTDSDRLENYVDEVSIMLGDEVVGSADAEDFSRDTSTNPDTYTETIQLSNAVVREGDEEKFYVAVTAVDTIDEDEQDAEFNVDIESVRFTDSTGAILTSDVTYTAEAFGFEDASEGDELTLESSSDNPEDATVKVEEDDESEDVLALVAELNNDEESSDATIFDLPVTIRVQQSSTVTTDVEEIIDSVAVEIDGDRFEADLSGSSTIDNDATVTYSLDLDNGDVVINAGDEVDVKVYVTFKEQEDNYVSGSTIVTASIDPDAIDAEGEDEEMDVEGSTKTGAALTLSISAAIVDVTDISSEKNEDDTVGTFSFEFTVEADGDEDVEFAAADVDYTILGTDTSATSVSLTKIAGDADEDSGTFTISSGDSATFVFDVTHNPDDAGVYRVRLDSVAGNDLGDEQIAGPQTLDAS